MHLAFATTESSYSCTGKTWKNSDQKVPYIVRVVKSIEIRKGPGAGYEKSSRNCPAGIFTIVEVKCGFGRLKSGARWKHVNLFMVRPAKGVLFNGWKSRLSSPEPGQQ